MKAKEFKVQLTSPSNKRGFLIKAIRIPRISDDVSAIIRKAFTERTWLKGKRIHRGTGPVDLLIGIDHACLHIGETKQSGHLVARNSHLGWVVFRAASRKIQQANNVLQVSYSTPVGLSKFLPTEAMGVAVKPCICSADKLTQLEWEETRITQSSCKKMGSQWMIPYPWKAGPKLLPDNRSQAFKKFEATECRLWQKSRECRGIRTTNTGDRTNEVFKEAVREGTSWVQRTSSLHCASWNSTTWQEKYPGMNRIQFIFCLSRPQTEQLLVERGGPAQWSLWNRTTV